MRDVLCEIDQKLDEIEKAEGVITTGLQAVL